MRDLAWYPNGTKIIMGKWHGIRAKRGYNELGLSAVEGEARGEAIGRRRNAANKTGDKVIEGKKIGLADAQKKV